MKKTLSLLLLLLIVSKAFSQKPVVIKLRTVTDSTVGYDVFSKLPEHATYARFYEFEDIRDSVYLNLHLNCFVDGSFMMSVLKCHASYSFAEHAEDGIYTIVIDNEKAEKISYVNGKREGLTCRYGQRPYNQYNPDLKFFDDKKLFFVQEYLNDTIVDYYALDQKGNVVEYLPIIKDSSVNLYELTYYFDQKGRLRCIDFAVNSVHYRTDYFSKSGKYKIKKKARDTHDKNQNRLVNNRKPEGWMEVKAAGRTFGFNFKDGVVLNWQVIPDSSYQKVGLDRASDEIGALRTDILEFIEF